MVVMHKLVLTNINKICKIKNIKICQSKKNMKKKPTVACQSKIIVQTIALNYQMLSI